MPGIDFALRHPALDLDKLFSLWTLALAPLIAHIVAGAPEPAYLSSKPPSWVDYVVFWNPTSIIWRYFTIFDRRLRAKTWNREILASTNALFWTTNGWDGSENMIMEARKHCLRLPPKSHAALLSKSFVNTVIVTLQGVLAVYQLTSLDEFNINLNLGTVFLPIALLGLVRLPSALWITDDFAYTCYDCDTNSINGPASQKATANEAGYYELTTVPVSDDDTSYAQFRPRTSIHGCIARAVFLIPVLAMATLAVFWVYYVFYAFSMSMSGTGFFSLMLWLTFSLGSTAIFLLNIARARDITTVVPGVSSVWYRLYTAALFLLMLGLFIAASMETRETRCGKFTISGDTWMCPDIREIPENTFVYFNATAIDGSGSWTGEMKAWQAYYAGIIGVDYESAILDATPETAYAFLEYIRNSTYSRRQL